MKKNQVHIGRAYVVKVSGQLARVRIDAESRFGGWEGTNLSTRRRVRIKSAQRLRYEVPPEKDGNAARAETPVVKNDAPPQDIDQRLAAAPPQYDPSRCATRRCRGTPVITHLGRPLCQACWERHCEEEQPTEVSENADDACLPVRCTQTGRPNEEQETHAQENVMSNKKKSLKKKSTRKQPKARSVAAKAKGTKKAGRPKAKATTEKKPERLSAIDAAAQVLKSAGKPMRAQELIAAMAEQGLWTSPGGKTPHATLYAAMQREERDKGSASRFRKVDRGLFAFNKEAK